MGALSAAAYVKYTDQEFVRQGQLVTGEDLVRTGKNAEVVKRTGDDTYYIEDVERGPVKAGGAGGGPPRSDRLPLITQTAAVTVGGDVAHTLTKEEHDASEDGTGRGTPVVTYNVRPEYGNGADLRVDETDVHPTLAQQTHLPGYDRGIRVQEQATVRRLTPMECERLMGWPDGWTDIPWNKKDHAPDSRRYAACGNGVVAPVAYWIGARLAEVLR
ncbi:MAG: DNA cytosine methyltransferase [Opitutales bacterium]